MKYLQGSGQRLLVPWLDLSGKKPFCRGFLGRGNCWITIAIPELLDSIACSEPVARILQEALRNQVEALAGVSVGQRYVAHAAG